MTGPEHYAAAERLLRDEYRTDRSVAEAQAHATLALAAATVDRLADTYVGDGDHINQWRAATGTARTVPLEGVPAVAYVYRATWDTTPLGTYTNPKAARTHCEVDASNHNPGAISFDWLGDESEPDSPYELAITQNGEEQPTDYTVTRIEVATEYDPEADA